MQLTTASRGEEQGWAGPKENRSHRGGVAGSQQVMGPAQERTAQVGDGELPAGDHEVTTWSSGARSAPHGPTRGRKCTGGLHQSRTWEVTTQQVQIQRIQGAAEGGEALATFCLRPPWPPGSRTPRGAPCSSGAVPSLTQHTFLSTQLKKSENKQQIYLEEKRRHGTEVNGTRAGQRAWEGPVILARPLLD